VRFNVADGLYKNGKYEEAAALFRALGADPASPVAAASRYNLGNSLFQKKDYRGALQAYRDALRVAPGDEDTRRNLEMALRALQEQEEQKKKQEKDQKDQQQKKDQPGQDRPKSPTRRAKQDGLHPGGAGRGASSARPACPRQASAPGRPAAQRAGGAARAPRQAAPEGKDGDRPHLRLTVRGVRPVALLEAWLSPSPWGACRQDQAVRSDVDARRIRVEDVVQWNVRLEGEAAQVVSEIAVPPLENLKVVGGPSVSTQISLVNGRMSQSKTYTWVLQPLATGAAKVSALEVKLPSGGVTSPAIVIEVVAGSLRPRGRPSRGANRSGPILSRTCSRRGARAEGKLFVEAVPSRSRPGGEGFLLTYFIYARGVQPTDMQSGGTPQYPGFWAENVESTDSPREETVTVEGETYARFPIYRKLLFATRAGDLTIPPLTVRVALARQSLFDSGMVVERSTKPVKVRVESLPAAVGPQGAVGSFKVETTAEPRSLRLGEAATVRFRVEGTGNLKWVEKGPDLVVPGAKVFAPQVKSSLQPRPDGFGGSKTWEYVVVPETGGRITIPALPFTWFDPGEGKVVSQGGAPIDLEVVGAANVAGLPAPGATTVSRGRGALALRDALDPPSRLLPPLPVRVLALVLLGAGLLHLALALSGRVGLGRSASARGATRAALRHLKRAREPGLAKEEAAALIERALHEAFANRNGEGAEDDERARVVARLVEEVQQVRYAPQLGDYSEKVQDLAQQARQAVERWT
jgi:hypothetical protein